MKNKKHLLDKTIVFILLVLSCFTLNAQTSETRILDVRDVTSYGTGVWCWAGCIASIANYFGPDDDISQCDVANLRRIRFNLGSVNCCSISRPYSLQDSTSCVHGAYFRPSDYDEIGPILNYDFGISYNYSSSILSYSSIKSQINNNKPIKIVVSKHTTYYSYHSMVIIGYDDDDQMIYYIDPSAGIFQDTYSDITSQQCMGVWGLWQYGLRYPTDWIPTSSPCPPNLNLTARIGSDATISAENEIECSSPINNDADVTFIAGNSVILTNGFEIAVGATLYANTSASPCQ